MTNSLVDAARALREEYDGEPSGNERFTRTRVMAQLREQQRKRITRLTLGIPLVAVLLGSAAWAASSGSLSVVVAKVTAVVTGERHPHSVPRAKLNPPRPISSQAPLPQAVIAEPSPASQTREEPATAPSIQVETAAAAVSTSRDPSVRTAASGVSVSSTASLRDSGLTERELSLYEAAHHAHFVKKDVSLALSAWSRYLTEVPKGRFLLEAKYNRALCLLRLGHNAEAAAELSRFAEGKFGGYRAKEARALINGFGGATGASAEPEP